MSCWVFVANPVNEGEDATPQSATRAVNLDRKTSEAKAQHQNDIVRLAIVLGNVLVVVIGVALLVVFLIFLPEKSTESHTSIESITHPTNPPTSLSFSNQVLNILPDYTITTIHQDADGSCPQSRAYQWLLDDPNLENHRDDRKLQRFALAMLCYSTTPTRGLGWTNALGWMDYEVHECDWSFKWIPAWLNTEMKCNVDLKGPCWESDLAEAPEEIYRHLGLSSNNLKGTIPGKSTC